MDDRTARVLDALGDPTRRAVLELVRERPRAVGEIAEQLPVSRPAVSKHLRVLEGAGLVAGRVAGRQHLYAVAREGLRGLQAWVGSFWDDVLSALDSHLQDAPEETP